MHLSPAILNLFQTVAFPVGFGGGIGTGSGFNPGNIPGLAAWYSADYGVYSDGAAHFTSASQQTLTAPYNSTLDLAGTSFTWYFWVKPSSVSVKQTLISRLTNLSSGFAFAVDLLDTAKVHLYLSSTGTSWTGNLDSVDTLTTGWNLVKVSYDIILNQMSIKINDGTAATGSYSGGVISVSSPLTISSAANIAQWFDGSWDTTVFLKRTTTAAEDTWFYNGGNGRVTSEVIAHPTLSNAISGWDFNEESGTRFDAIGSNNFAASNTVLISPSVNNGGFETAGALPPVFANWGQQAFGTSTINNEGVIVHTGTHACRFDIDSSGNPAYVRQQILRIGDVYSYSVWGKASSTSGVMSITDANKSINSVALTTTYTQYLGNFTASTNTIYFQGGGASSPSVYVDDVTLTDLGPVGIAGIAAGLATDGNFCGNFARTSSQSLSVASNASLQPGSGSFSISGWVYFSSLLGNMGIVSKWTSGTEYLIWMRTSSATILFNTTTTGTPAALENPLTLVPGSWYFVVATYDGVTASLSVNNGTPATAPSTGSITGTSDLFSFGSFNGVTLNCLDGRLDGVGFWKGHVLSAGEQTALFNHGNGLKSAGLVAAGITTPTSYWDLDKKAGLLVDAFSSNTLTNNNGVTYAKGVDYFGGAVARLDDRSANANNAIQTTEALRPVWYSNVVNGKAAIYYSGANFLSLLNGIASEPVTIFAVTQHTVTALQGIVGGPNGGGMEYRFDNADKQRATVQGVVDIGTSTTAVSKTAFSLVDLSYDGTNYIFGLNGVNDGSGANAQTFTEDIKELGAGGGEFLTGYIAMLIIYGRVLTTAERQQVRNFAKNYYGIS